MAEVKMKYQYSVMAILILALGLRLWGITHEIYTDENKVISTSVLLAQGKQKPLLYPKGSYYPHLYHYVLGAAFLPAALLDAPYPGSGTSVDAYTLIARIITALLGTATIFVTYKIGKELQSPMLGIIGALLLAVLPLHVKYSHYTHVDIPLTFITSLTVLASIYVWKRGDIKFYVTTGILTGMSGSVHYTGFVVGIALLIAHAIRMRNHRNIFIALLCIPIAFAATTPYTLIMWQQSKEIYETLQARGAAGDLGYTRPSFTWPVYTSSPDWGLPFTLSGIWWEFHPIIISLAAFGFLLSIWKRNWSIVALLGGTILIMYIAIVGKLPLYAIKRLLPLTPLVCIYAAWAVHELLNSTKVPHTIKYSIAGIIITVILAHAGIQDMGFDAAYAQGSTHSTAVAWALNNIPHGSVVLQHTPIKLLDWNDTNYKTLRINEVYANFNVKDPEVSHDRAKPLSYWTQEQGAQFIAMDSRIVDRYFDPTSVALFPETTASYQAFYQKIREHGKQVYTIEPKLWHIAGPRIEIYDIRNIQ